MKQKSFPQIERQLTKDQQKELKIFGGSLIKGHAREKRPWQSHMAMHVILRSSKAKGLYSLLHKNNKHHIEACVRKNAKKYGVRIYKFANVGNHLHLLIRVRRRRFYASFIRAVTGHIARIALGAKKTLPCLGINSQTGQREKFWDYLPCTRLVGFAKRSYSIAKDYVALNVLEGLGVIQRQEFALLKRSELRI